MTTLGSKRPRESDVHDASAITADVASAAASGVTAAGPSASTRNSKKARTSNTNNATEGEATLPTSDSNPAQEAPPTTEPHDPLATTTGDSGQNVPTGDTAEEAQQQPTKAASKRSQRKSAMAAKDKLVAAENVADQDEQQPAGKDAAPQEPQGSKPASTAPIKSRGRGGDRPAETTAGEAVSAPSSSPAAATPVVAQNPAAQQPATAPAPPQPGLTPSGPGHPDPSNPYLVRYGDPNNPYAHIPGMPPPGMMLPHNPYLPPPPAGYPMFPPPGMMAPGAQPYPMMHMQPPPPPPGFNPAAAQAAAMGEKKDGESDEKEGEQEGDKEGEGSGENQSGQPGHPPPTQHAPYGAYAFPPGFAGHMPPPEFVPNPADPNAHHHHPYGHAHLLPPLHHPHPPNTHQPPHLAHPGMQLTLPLAVTDHTLPSHLDAVIRAPESLSITYTEVPEGTYLLRSDFGEAYPKQLEPPRKTTDMRCLFCKRHYSGPNARGMWRRHVTGKHDFVFERKTAAGGHTGGRPRPKTAEQIDSGEDDGDDGPPDVQGGDAASGMQGQPEGVQGPGEMAMVGPDGMMGLLSMNGMPVHPLPPGVGGYPPHGMAPMHILPGTNIPISSIPPHPVAPMSKRRPSGGARPGGPASGVGMGNGGGGLVPRVHPLLTKEERIERARASKRHYAMKRRALEKMKQGGIPKGARLVEGMFILADGTQIPADPNVEYRDLSVAVHHATSYQQASSAAQEDGLIGDVSKKSKKSKGKGKKVDDEDDDDDDAMDATMISMDQGLAHPSMEGLVSMEAPAGVSVDMDPWAEQAAVFHAQQVQAQQVAATNTGMAPPTLQQQYQQQQVFGAAKMADVPVVPRGQQSQPELSEVLSGIAVQPAKATRKSPRKGNAMGEADGQAQSEDVVAAGEGIPEDSGPGPAPTGEDGEERRFCYCNDVEYGSMIGCDNGSNCPREWFHLGCTDIEGDIPAKWYCKDCRQTIQQQDQADGVDEAKGAEEQPAAAAADQEAEPTESPKGRPRRGRPAKGKDPEPTSPTVKPASSGKSASPKKGGKKVAKVVLKTGASAAKPKGDSPAPADGEDHEVESEDEVAAEDGAAAPEEKSPKKPVSTAKSTTSAAPESPGRTRRSTRAAAAAAAA